MLDSLYILMALFGALSDAPSLPFWATAGNYGLMCEKDGGLALVQAGATASFEEGWRLSGGLSAGFNATADGVGQIFRGTSSGGATAGAFVPASGERPDFNFVIDQLYASLSKGIFSFDAGWRREPLQFTASDAPLAGSLSMTGGNIAMSGNAPTMPGYTLRLDGAAIPFTSGKLTLSGAYGDYLTMDDRYVKGALVHRTAIYFDWKILPRLDFRIGIDHYALWGGEHPDEGRMAASFGNYLRVVTGRSAPAGGTESDRINVLGDHRGAELLRLRWRGEGYTITLQHDIPYDDGSGMGFQNFPDGVNTLSVSFGEKGLWVSDLVYEHATTMWQSGPAHDAPGETPDAPRIILGGVDNYFNNSYYLSGWTHFGRTIGFPLFFPSGSCASASAFARETGIENNRLTAHHIGVAGSLFRRAPYRLMLTFSRNYGTYGDPYRDGEALRQFSAAFNGNIPAPFGVRRMRLNYGLYYDRGEVLPNGFGAILGFDVKIY